METATLSTVSGTLNSVGMAAGTLGFIAFSITLVFPTRLHILEKWLHGLPRLYFLHHIAGIVAFELLLLHPILLALSRAISDPASGAYLLTPRADPLLLSGWLGLLILMVAIGATFLKGIRYEIWRVIHSLTGIAFVISLGHALLAASGLMQIFYVAIGVPAVASFFYWEVYHRLRSLGHSYKIVDSRPLAAKITELILEPVAKALAFRAGQFVYLSVVQAPHNQFAEYLEGEAHPFTIASSPTDRRLRLVIKAAGDFTDKLSTLQPGSEVRLEGPYGDFFHRTGAKRSEVWIAGGIGIVPFLSRARSGDFSAADLHFFAPSQLGAPFAEELANLASDSRLRVFTHYGATKDGAMILEQIEKDAGTIEGEREVYTCGPKPFMCALRQTLRKRHFPTKLFHTEEFNWL